MIGIEIILTKVYTALKRCGIDLDQSNDRPPSLMDDLQDSKGTCRIQNISGTFYEKLVRKISAKNLRNILKYKYFLNTCDPIRVKEVKLLLYKETIHFIFHFKTDVKAVIHIDRSGKLTSVDANRKNYGRVKSTESNNNYPFELSKISKQIIYLTAFIFNGIDKERLRSILSESLSINLNQNIVCEYGSLIANNGQFLYKFIIKFGIEFFLLCDCNGNFIKLVFTKNPVIWAKILREYRRRNIISTINLFRS